MNSPTNYDLTVEEQPSYIFAKVEGDEPPSNGPLDYLEPIAECCATYGCSAVLIEKHTPEPFAIWDTFLVAPQLAQLGFPCIKIAVVEHGAKLEAQTELSVMIGHKCGLDVHVFPHKCDAVCWLLNAGPPQAR